MSPASPSPAAIHWPAPAQAFLFFLIWITFIIKAVTFTTWFSEVLKHMGATGRHTTGPKWGMEQVMQHHTDQAKQTLIFHELKMWWAFLQQYKCSCCDSCALISQKIETLFRQLSPSPPVTVREAGPVIQTAAQHWRCPTSLFFSHRLQDRQVEECLLSSESTGDADTRLYCPGMLQQHKPVSG